MSKQTHLFMAVATLLGTTLGCLVVWKAVRDQKRKVTQKENGESKRSEEETESEDLYLPALPQAAELLTVQPMLVSCKEEWEEMWPSLQKDMAVYPVLGMDCEWVSVNGKPGLVSLLQIATFSGLCVLIRLPKLNRNDQTVPQTLLAIMQDAGVLKVGVGCYEDGDKLLQDYGMVVKCTVDLRYLAIRHSRSLIHNGLSLKTLSEDILNFSLNKSLNLRCSNWEADQLSQEQITYAGRDAQASVALFFHLLGLVSEGPLKDRGTQQLLAKCQGLIDIPFKLRVSEGENEDDSFSEKKKRSKRLGCEGKQCLDQVADPRKNKRKPLGVGFSARKSPLYDNCFLHAPDGQPLCTCDKKKARWYLEKGIGELISEDPFIVKLTFEPSGRPESQQDYYLTAKENLCVVCGKTDSYIRKNIVPHEYRRHFPVEMKDHNSHDVLLLCTSCHATSNYYDTLLKQQLAEEYNAPLGCEDGVRLLEDGDRRQVRSAARALLNAESLPECRKVELLKLIQDFFGIKEVTTEKVQEAAGLETRIFNENYVPHGLKVVKMNAKGGLLGLMELEKRWRQHFLTVMKPRHLPPLWSVDHNHSKLLRKYGDQLDIQLH
ncbi:exonuclease 3'-5' domain-containing protein 2 isoform X1 [Erpetoichthys calabaricus]|uniref:Exonuclease 3'-5' domain-containing protein 2 n=1 Tax=Erpetoichthys calabaricus TaxID=27687 RepID=A0A8C4T506_ERPCA|nr:exonuclease 3'-5' domain-containing protein 2 isoform X1 [Erpetoichthys calabaricus]XP_028677280.1 exonuclease 3'-5' domain-containing protein 2 isoform X1 [Erpetoichthys calabaricus]